MNEDEFIPASKEEVRKRIKEGRYLPDIEIMQAYVDNATLQTESR